MPHHFHFLSYERFMKFVIYCRCVHVAKGDYVHILKFIGGGRGGGEGGGGGGIMSTLKNSWGDYVHLHKNEQGEGGYCPTL